MRSDMDRLMRELNLDAAIVLSDEAPNTYHDYLTKRSRSGGTVVKKRGQEPILVVGDMELGMAERSGLKVYRRVDFGEADLRQQYPSDPLAVQIGVLRNLLEQEAIQGRVAFYGVADIADILSIFLDPRMRLPGIEIVTGKDATDLFSRMYETKDAEEISQLQEAGRLTSEVVRRTWNFISGHRAEGEAVGSRVVNDKGEPLTIGAVKRFIRIQELELGLEDPEGCIFSQGRDAALPHSVGEDADVLQVGKTIVFDIFPRLSESGYFHDMTRTWCIGHAPAEIQAVYDDVMTVFHIVEDSLRVGQLSNKYQHMAFDYFESKGHPTRRKNPGSLDGYHHGLGHGMGLNIHEAPQMSDYRPPTALVPGNVITVEPGLYFPDRGFGVRVEDTVYFDQDGRLVTLTDFPHDLVLPLRG
jgi:Xaa-Pro aminopeptidase